MSVTFRISLIFLLVYGVGFYLFVEKEIEETKRRYREATEEPLIDFATVLASQLGGTGSELTVPDHFRTGVLAAYQKKFSANVYGLEKDHVDLRVYVTNREGTVLFDSAGGRAEGEDYSEWNDVVKTLRGEYGARSSQDDPDRRNVTILYVAAPIHSGGEIVGALTVGKPTANSNLFIEAAKRSTWLLGATTFFGVAFLSFLLFWLVTRPLRKLTSFVREVRDGTRSSIPKLGSGEIRSLAGAFEEMRSTLEGKQYIEKYVQTLTHELKSPLTGVKAAAEILKENPPEEQQQKFIANIEEDSDRIQRLIDKLLSLSTLEAKRALEDHVVFSLSELVRNLGDELESSALYKNVKLNLQVEDKLTCSGDEFWIREAFLNIITNAIEFSPPGSTASVKLSHIGDSVQFQVQDQGSGMPDWAIERCFERFYSLPRPSTGKKSSGLGLSIAREVAELHGGEVSVRNREVGGLEVTVLLPASTRK